MGRNSNKAGFSLIKKMQKPALTHGSDSTTKMLCD